MHGNRFRLFGLCYFVCFLLLWKPLSDPDFWWHLRYGQQILHTHRLPRTDQFSWTFYGRPFVDFYWLFELLVAFLFSTLHPLGLTIIFAGATALLLLLQTDSAFRTNWSLYAVVVLFAAAITSIAGVRPVVISWILFCILLWIIRQIETWSVLKTIVVSLLLFVCWMNMHDGFVFPLLYAGLLWGCNGLFACYSWLKPTQALKPFLTEPAFRNLTILLVVAGICLLLTPYGFNYPLTILRESLSSQNKMYIAEWQPLPLQTEMGILYYGISFSVLVYGAYKRYFTPAEYIILPAIIFIGAISSVNVGFVLLVLLPITVTLAQTIPLPADARFFAKLYTGVLTIAAAITFFLGQFSQSIKTPMLAGKAYPAKAVASIKQLRPAGNVFNYYGWGGYMIYTLPQYKVFIDGRTSSWQLGNRSPLAEEETIAALQPHFLSLLQHYNPNWFFLPPNEALTQWLLTNPKYKVLYEDSLAVVIVRK